MREAKSSARHSTFSTAHPDNGYPGYPHKSAKKNPVLKAG